MRGIAALLTVTVAVGLAWFAPSWSTAVLGSTSMEPWAAPGDLLVHRTVPAAEVAVGDVVTIPVPGRGLVTHRIVELTGASGARTAVLKGDRSRLPDPAPVALPEDVDRVVVVVPQLGSALRIGGPWLSAAIALVLVGLVVVAVTRQQSEVVPDRSPRLPADAPAPADPRVEALLATCEQLADDGLAPPVVADVVRVRVAAIAGLPHAEVAGPVLALDDGARFYVLAVADADAAMLRLVPADSRRRREASEALDRWWATVTPRLGRATRTLIETWTEP
jgi:signal peptidase